MCWAGGSGNSYVLRTGAASPVLRDVLVPCPAEQIRERKCLSPVTRSAIARKQTEPNPQQHPAPAYVDRKLVPFTNRQSQFLGRSSDLM